MARQLAKFDTEIGAGSDAHAQGGVFVEGGLIKARIEFSYPVVKALEPVTTKIDAGLDKLAEMIPGDWDKAILEKLKAEYKEELMKLVNE